MDRPKNNPFARPLVAFVVGLLGCVCIWVAVPYNNFLFVNTGLSDSFLPEAVVALLLLLLLGVNPLLRLIGPRWMLDRGQVALIGGLLLFAAILPSNGLMRMFPRFVAEANRGLNDGVTTSRIAADASLPEALFPDPLPKRGADGSVQTFDTPNSEQFLNELTEGNSLPWSAWAAPMATWGLLIGAIWMMMLGLAGIVYPQWRDRERLPFPLLNVYQAFTGDADTLRQGWLPGVFVSRGFWIALVVVFLIHGFRGLNVFTQAVPYFPLEWNLKDYLNDTIFRDTTRALERQVIFFSVIGVAYAIPNRYSFSIWAWVVTYSLYVTFGKAYIPAFDAGQVNDQTFGVVLAIVLWTLWLGRAHWANVGRAMLGRAAGDEERQRDRVAGWMFVIGCGGMVSWLTWAGCSLWWSLVATGSSAMVALTMSRVIAETGVPLLWLSRFSVGSVAALLPLSWLSPNILFFNAVLYALITRATAVNAAVMATLALGIARDSTPRQQTRVLLSGLAVLLVGFAVCGAVHLHMGYNNTNVKTAAKMEASAIDAWDRAQTANYDFFSVARAQQGVGFGVGSALLWACSRFPGWPIHPVGILFCQHSIGDLIWFSIFLGWLVKVLITSLFGGGAYRKARPVFIGLILGEVIAVVLWALVPVIIVLLTGQSPADVPRYTLIQYP